MIIKALQLKDFRNYENLDIGFSGKTNIFYGDNAQGKTNILESIFLMATTKSYRGAKEKEMIRHDSGESHIRIVMNKMGADHRLDMHLKKNSPKGAAIDGIPIRKSSELYGMLHVISFSPEDLTLIKNGPSERRRFMDMELCQLDRVYFSNLASYGKALAQRNNLLKQIDRDRALAATIDIWNEQLVKYGTEIIKAREDFINSLAPVLCKKHESISSGKEKLRIEYVKNTREEEFLEKLEKSLDRDIYLKATSYGPHKDDLAFFINDDNVRIYGSQGQQRTAALSLKLSEIELVKNRIGDSPVLLLDDVLSELDRNRQNSLLNEIKEVQTFITCTGLEEFIESRSSDNRIFHIEGGKVILGG